MEFQPEQTSEHQPPEDVSAKSLQTESQPTSVPRFTAHLADVNVHGNDVDLFSALQIADKESASNYRNSPRKLLFPRKLHVVGTGYERPPNQDSVDLETGSDSSSRTDMSGSSGKSGAITARAKKLLETSPLISTPRETVVKLLDERSARLLFERKLQLLKPDTQTKFSEQKQYAAQYYSKEEYQQWEESWHMYVDARAEELANGDKRSGLTSKEKKALSFGQLAAYELQWEENQDLLQGEFVAWLEEWSQYAAAAIEQQEYNQAWSETGGTKPQRRQGVQKELLRTLTDSEMTQYRQEAAYTDAYREMDFQEWKKGWHELCEQRILEIFRENSRNMKYN